MKIVRTSETMMPRREKMVTIPRQEPHLVDPPKPSRQNIFDTTETQKSYHWE
jgi:hypothetical protein